MGRAFDNRYFRRPDRPCRNYSRRRGAATAGKSGAGRRRFSGRFNSRRPFTAIRRRRQCHRHSTRRTDARAGTAGRPGGRGFRSPRCLERIPQLRRPGPDRRRTVRRSGRIMAEVFGTGITGLRPGGRYRCRGGSDQRPPVGLGICDPVVQAQPADPAHGESAAGCACRVATAGRTT